MVEPMQFPSVRQPPDLRSVAPANLDRLLALTRATQRLLGELGADVPLDGGRGATARTLGEACRAVELQAALARFHRARAERGDLPAAEAVSGRTPDVLRRLLRGESEKEIAAWLDISPHTVHVYVKAIYRLYRVHSRGELFALFIEQPNE